MRVLVALVLSVAVALAAAAPHLHLHAAQGGEECAVCQARSGEAATRQSPDLRPADPPVETVAAWPVLRPVAGAPLGAVPGQSPPLA
jgi:hypothetical protein